jgi:hypothetical protein
MCIKNFPSLSSNAAADLAGKGGPSIQRLQVLGPAPGGLGGWSPTKNTTIGDTFSLPSSAFFPRILPSYLGVVGFVRAFVSNIQGEIERSWGYPPRPPSLASLGSSYATATSGARDTSCSEKSSVPRGYSPRPH